MFNPASRLRSNIQAVVTGLENIFWDPNDQETRTYQSSLVLLEAVSGSVTLDSDPELQRYF